MRILARSSYEIGGHKKKSMLTPHDTKNTPEVISDYQVIVADLKSRNSQVKASAGGFSAGNHSLADKGQLSSPSSVCYPRAAAFPGGSAFMGS